MLPSPLQTYVPPSCPKPLPDGLSHTPPLCLLPQVFREMVVYNKGLDLPSLMPKFKDAHLNPPKEEAPADPDAMEAEVPAEGEEGEAKKPKEELVTSDTFRDLLDMFAHQQAQIDAIAASCNVDIVRILCEELKAAMIPSPTNCLHLLRELLPELGKELLHAYMEEIRAVEDQMTAPCSTPEEYSQKLSHLEAAQAAEKTMERRCLEVQDLYRLIQDYTIPIAAPEAKEFAELDDTYGRMRLAMEEVRGRQGLGNSALLASCSLQFVMAAAVRRAWSVVNHGAATHLR